MAISRFEETSLADSRPVSSFTISWLSFWKDGLPVPGDLVFLWVRKPSLLEDPPGWNREGIFLWKLWTGAAEASSLTLRAREASDWEIRGFVISP